MCWLLENICRIKRRASWNILFGQRWWENCWFCCLLRFIDWSLPASTLLPFFKSSLRYTTPRERFITHRSTCPRANALLFIMEQMFRGDITLFNLALFLIFHPHIWILNFCALNFVGILSILFLLEISVISLYFSILKNCSPTGAII